MTRLADHLCDAGHRVVRADLRGFGEAEADVPEATIHEHYRSIERGLHVDDLLSVVEALDDDGTPLVLFGSCGGAVTAVRAAEREARVQAVVAYALPAVLTGGRGAELAGRRGPSRGLTVARLGLGEAVLRGTRGRLLPGGLAPWLNAPLIRALRGLAGDRARAAAVRRRGRRPGSARALRARPPQGRRRRRAAGHRPPLRRPGRRRARRRGDGQLAREARRPLRRRRRRRALPG